MSPDNDKNWTLYLKAQCCKTSCEIYNSELGKYHSQTRPLSSDVCGLGLEIVFREETLNELLKYLVTKGSRSSPKAELL